MNCCIIPDNQYSTYRPHSQICVIQNQICSHCLFILLGYSGMLLSFWTSSFTQLATRVLILTINQYQWGLGAIESLVVKVTFKHNSTKLPQSYEKKQAVQPRQFKMALQTGKPRRFLSTAPPALYNCTFTYYSHSVKLGYTVATVY